MGLTDFFKEQLHQWKEVQIRFEELRNVRTHEVGSMLAQYNPARMVSTGAKIDKATLAQRPCFLCDKNRPLEQIVLPFNEEFDILVNPFPILPTHFTIPARKHQPQAIAANYPLLHQLLTVYPHLMVFYNGPKCGASAPDHLHFQAGTSGVLPLQQHWQQLYETSETLLKINDYERIVLVKDYVSPAIAIISKSLEHDEQMFRLVYDALPIKEGETEPMMNIVAWRANDTFISVVFPRYKHRPDCYFAEKEQQFLVSPGSLDMAGLMILPREVDFERITPTLAEHIMREVSLSDEAMREVIKHICQHNVSPWKQEPVVSVGIVSAEKIHFRLNGSYLIDGELITGEQTVEYSKGEILWQSAHLRELVFTPKDQESSFSLDDVTIGLNFHWERKEVQTFLGTLHLIVDNGKLYAINELSVEDYLTSVISSEMSATSSLELLKAHAVISRSWLLAQIEKRKSLGKGTEHQEVSTVRTDNELVRWFDREDHTLFDVCADDHCQRYQGITKATSPHVKMAIDATRGQVLFSEGSICDARFSKCCGGISEEFQYCWENIRKPYLLSVEDKAPLGSIPTMDLTDEEAAREWILSSPEAFCNTHDEAVLGQVLNNYDQETQDFYRWTVEFTQAELSVLIAQKTGIDFGGIKNLVPLSRGKSGRIYRMRIEGTKRSYVIGKELEIRRALSESHLYSSAFVVDSYDIVNGVPQHFRLTGAGWGHGVGLCQIGAAMMGEKGYDYQQILYHYYKNAEVRRLYE